MILEFCSLCKLLNRVTGIRFVNNINGVVFVPMRLLAVGNEKICSEIELMGGKKERRKKGKRKKVKKENREK